MAVMSKAELIGEHVTVIARFTDGTGGKYEPVEEFSLTGDGLMRLRHLTNLLWAEHLIRRCIEWDRGNGGDVPPSVFTARMMTGYRAHRLNGEPIDLDTPLVQYRPEPGEKWLRLYLLPEE